jgi:AcrR family transcriptional regulator
VDGLLRAAARVIAKGGYEAATMSAIAACAESAIGSLYQFFPNKESVVDALRAQYARELEDIWDSLAAEANRLTVEKLVSRLIRSQVDFAERHAAFFALFDAPPTVNTVRRREMFRLRIARVILKRNPRIPRNETLRIAAVVQQIVKGLLTLYARADKAEKGIIVGEFKSVLTGYLVPKLRP